MRAAILTIGDELLIGQVIDTNSAWISQQLNFIGVRVAENISIGDDALIIKETLSRLLNANDFVFISGGLGPTKDDLTKLALTEFFQDQLVMHEPSLQNINRIFAAIGRQPNPSNIQQAMQPSKAKILVNKNGTASGMWFERDGKVVVSMPGVPFELKEMFSMQVIPELIQRFSLPTIIHKTICTQGIGESYAAEKIEDIESALPSDIKLAYLPSVGQLKLRLSGYDNVTDTQINHYADAIVERISNYVFGFNDVLIQEVIGGLLKQQGKTISTAESCTGGYVAHLITSISGSSAYFTGGVIAYSNEIKTKILGVNAKDIEKHGAVSKQVVEQMALGVLKITASDFAIATSGIAGPTGGSVEKPVGTVWIAVAGKNGIFSKDFKFGDNRERNIIRASLTALNILRKELLKK